jgi:hypothetical protein
MFVQQLIFYFTVIDQMPFGQLLFGQNRWHWLWMVLCYVCLSAKRKSWRVLIKAVAVSLQMFFLNFFCFAKVTICDVVNERNWTKSNEIERNWTKMVEMKWNLNLNFEVSKLFVQNFVQDLSLFCSKSMISCQSSF